ncbi:hypothetical protein KPL78_02665 [Roseomonas sp. HJA6]|uniref:Common-antigen outer membrane protein n=1 Tax=Roseomonas alba TaxID=2846776 RepID=A0ABS7A3J5_9PROT|nr:DVU3141 family protein [Neoroseomonas alba]MBW6396728.1 hypothetical protein [Neoroseomonas alba]
MILARHHGERGMTRALLGGVLLLAGCGLDTAGPTTDVVAPAAISDPVIAFAAHGGGAGAEETVTLPSTGQVVRLRLVRAYLAASGSECREVEVGAGGSAYSRLVCSAGTGWREARPLLRSASRGP